MKCPNSIGIENTKVLIHIVWLYIAGEKKIISG
jgi:hypothetical protein